jgi:molecular chaperone HscB
MNLADNDFVLFALPEQYALNLNELQTRWKAALSATHPDRFSQAGAAGQRLAMQWSVRLNEAYQRLRHPLKRAEYLCALRGVPVHAERNTSMPAAFLMQQMEWREAMEDAKLSKNIGDLEQLLAEMELDAKKLQGNLTDLIDTKKDYTAATDATRKLIFIDKVCADIHKAIEHLEV